MKFGKSIQKKQLEIPEYAASFVDYKALKRLIKELKNSPVTRPGIHASEAHIETDPQSVLQANKAPFFFRLDRELDKVNDFYTIKEEEAKVRLKGLIDKQKSMRIRNPVISKTSTQYITLEQGLKDFIRDLNKLQQFIEINATAFSKILKKWDKTSKSQTKELYLSRAVEVQPCFNHDVISDLSDQANACLLDCAAWAEGEGTLYANSPRDQQILSTPRLEQDEADSDALDALNRGDLQSLRGLLDQIENAPNAAERITKLFITAVSSAPEAGLKLTLETNLVDLDRQDEINDRNCLHKTAMTGRSFFLKVGLAAGVDPSRADAYGRIPLHYASMNGHVHLIQDLVEARPPTIDVRDLDNFTALIHAIVHGHLACVEKILSYSARVDPSSASDHIPLNLACQRGSVPIVELLLRGSPRIMTDAEGLYPQHLVARFGRDPELLFLLQKYGANLDQPDKLYQWTPLFHAASEGRVECLKKLLESGVNAKAVDEKGLSAQYYATWEGHMECMAILASTVASRAAAREPVATRKSNSRVEGSVPQSLEVEVIPDLSLPPPIIPTRRYGHNFLASKTTVVLSFEDSGRSAVTFYDETKYPAARLTIAPRSSDILPRNILLPIQDENRSVSFEMDRLETFAVDFDVFPTFGKKVIAKGSVPAEVFLNRNRSSGYHHLSLLDPRLRCIGQLYFKFQVIKPFSGAPLDITPYATYWKATSQLESQPSSLVTGSSLSGEYLRLFVQQTRDGVPILYPQWTVNTAGVEMPVIGLSHEQFSMVGESKISEDAKSQLLASRQRNDLAAMHRGLAYSYMSLNDALFWIPANMNLEFHVLYPNICEEERYRLGPTMNINDFVDNLLQVVFQHARRFREGTPNSMRSIVLTSYNKDLCTALNWKQPNFPVLLCNNLGETTTTTSSSDFVPSSGHTAMSIKEAVRVAQTNNFMGLICQSHILDMLPALVEAIKVAGLVLVSDASVPQPEQPQSPQVALSHGMPEGIDGVLRDYGVLIFNQTIDV